MNAIILAGGEATRLGPLAAQLNKCLITVGQQPMLVHQVNALRKVGVTRVVVVASARSLGQVQDVAHRAYGDLPNIDVQVIAQSRGTSPVNALVDGLEHILRDANMGAQAFVLAADTLVERIPEEPVEHTWAHVVLGMADATRSWTVMEANGTWNERPALQSHDPVYTGLMFIHDVAGAYAHLAPWHVTARPFSTATALNKLKAGKLFADPDIGWRDVGDLDALADARRTQYIARASHALELDEDGIVWKTGDVHREVDYFRALSPTARTLFPRTHIVDHERYGTDHTDQPTLAELWLYWPGHAEMWTSIIERLCARVDRTLWQQPWVEGPSYIQKCAMMMYVEQLVVRLRRWGHPIFDADTLVINGAPHVAGRRLVELLLESAVALCSTVRPTLIHGDLSFMNILWSITTGQPKLLDPRGGFGQHSGPGGDMRYDLGKLRYSYHGGVCAILHGLYDLEWSARDAVTWHMQSQRTPITDQLDQIIGSYNPLRDIELIEAIMCLAGAPVHQANESESLALYTRGVELGNGALR